MLGTGTLGTPLIGALALAIFGCSGGQQALDSVGAGRAARTPGAAGASLHHTRVDDTPRWLVITAMQLELDPLLAVAEIEHERAISGRTYRSGRLAGADVVLLAGGVSMVNATMSTQEAIHHYTLEGIVMVGIAGGVRPDIGIGSVTIPAQWAQYQEHAFTDDRERGRRRGLGNFGMMYPGKVRVTRHSGQPDDAELMLWFPADEKLLLAARRALGGAPPLERCNEQDQCVDSEPRTVIDGSGVSGPTFVDHEAYRDFIWEAFQPDVLDMETAAVAHVAYSSELPYIAVRSLSDLAGGRHGPNRYASFGRMAARNAAAVAIAVLRELARKPS